MILAEQLQEGLEQELRLMAGKSVAEMLNQHQVLPKLARQLVTEKLISAQRLSPLEQAELLEQLWQGVNLPKPQSLEGDWWEALPTEVQAPLRQRCDQLKLAKYVADRYAEQLEPYFLQRRADLEQVVYGVIRLRSQGVAEEMYLRLVEGEADFTELARVHSVGDERYTHGLVGPMPISQPHSSLRQVLMRLKVGELHPPLRLDPWFLLIRLEHRQPAKLDDRTRDQLLNELFEKEISEFLRPQLEVILPNLTKFVVSAFE